MLTYRFAAVCLLIPVVALAAHSELGATLAIDMVQTPGLRDEIKEDAEFREILEVVNREIQRRIAIKEALIAELIAGRVTLAATTEQFLTMNQDRPEYMMIIRASYPGRTDYEKSAYNVISYAEGELQQLPPEAQEKIRARFAAELRDLNCHQSAAPK